MKTVIHLIVICAFALLAACEQKPAETAPQESAPATPAPAPAEPATEPEAEQSEAAGTPEAAAPEPVVSLQPESPGKDSALPDPVATVNGQPISRDEFEKTLDEIFGAMGMQPSMLPPDQQALLHRQFAEDMIIDRLIDQASAEVKVTAEEVDGEIARFAEQHGSMERFAEELAASGQTLDEFKSRLERLIRQRKWMDTQVPAESQVADAEVQKFYDDNKAEFEQPDLVRASHILLRVDEDAEPATVEAKQKEAEAIAGRAKAGEDFGALATELSEDPSAKQNAGDLDFFARDRMVPEFADAAFTQEVGSVGEPVRTRFGWHIIKVTDKKTAQTLPFEEVKADIAEYLKEGKQQQAVDEVIQKLRAEADVVVHLIDPEGGSGQPSEPARGNEQ